MLLPPHAPLHLRTHPLRAIALALWTTILLVLLLRLGLTPTRHTVYYPLFQDTGLKWANAQDVYDKIGNFRYCPLIAPYFTLLSHLPLALAEYLWLLPNLLLLALGLYDWLKSSLPGNLSTDARWLIPLLATPMLIGNLSNLQANPMVLGLMLLATTTTLRKQFTLASLAITLATLLKIYPLGLGLLFLLLHPKPFSWRLPLFLALGLLAPFLTQHPDFVLEEYRRLYFVLAHDSRLNQSLAVVYRDASILWYLLHLALPAYIGAVNATLFHLYQLLFAAYTAAATLWTRIAKINPITQHNFVLHLFTLWILLAGPSTESATFILGAPLAAWLLIAACHSPSKPFKISAITAYALLTFAAALAWLPFAAFFKAVPLQCLGSISLLIALQLWIKSNTPQKNTN